MKLLTQSLFLSYLIIAVNSNVNKNFTQDSCGVPGNGVYFFAISASAPIESKEIAMLIVHYDEQRQMAVSTTALHSGLNHIQTAERKDNFRQLPCPELEGKQTNCKNTFKMTAEQIEKTGRTAWDRGHLTPVNPMRFSEDAVDNTYYCINISPQEPYTNQGPWFTVENCCHQYFKEFPGYVMTGTCKLNNFIDGLTIDGYQVPACFWKMVCYNDQTTGETRALGFIANNTLFHKDSAEDKQQRTASTIEPRMQNEILQIVDPNLIANAWMDSSIYLPEGRNENNLPDPFKCINALTVPESVLNEWRNFISLAPPPPEEIFDNF